MGEMSWEAGGSQGEVWLGQRQREKEDRVLIPGRRERLEDRQREEQACCKVDSKGACPREPQGQH